MELFLEFQNENFDYQIAGTESLLQILFKQEGVSKVDELTIVFCTDDYLLDVNKQFLQHDYYTDIITFNLSEPNEPLMGELYISVDRVEDNAGTEGVSFENELKRVIIHGCLHLCGYEDNTDELKHQMRSKENQYLQLW